MNGFAAGEPDGVCEEGSSPSIEDTLWATLTAERSAAAREAVFAHFLPYAHAVAAQLFAGRLRDDVEFRDFLQLACVGLLEAIDRYAPERGVAFQTFCTPRLKGSVLTGVARLSDGQEQIALRQRMRRERVASLEPEAEAGNRRARDTFQALGALAAGLAIGFMLEDTGLIEEPFAKPAPYGTHDTYGNAYQALAWRQTRGRLHAAVSRLPERNQKIIRYHYFHGLGFAQIADILGLTKGRISQLHRAALLELRTQIGNSQHLHLIG
ncbi:sigma-70 family RNA polymerase sigma factor [Paraburkholderia terricola]|uniref:RNA polymerase sigma factor for flagellar operon FliA n=1 Tax=Paraburkholderia terricola TaxID=169427 RepID=A0ABU1LX46_9BURK|nr:sigma-70 family RNA polymerase sigma factor [Paraburkholderia terricola]MDR6411323.1 RNA polymerase sigma factor for flagellar operon FliA [Paraburkholderia terricola]MDR6483437.1 RNA polymerase sigma factor for flagellar operon FliA [Paraburkholderia terricola]